MPGQTRGRIMWNTHYDEQEAGVFMLMTAIVQRARRDIEQVKKLGKQATAHQRNQQQEAEQFIQEMRRWAR